MKILVVGSGGREHALVWKIKQSPKVKTIYCAPGNAGIAKDAICVDIVAGDIDKLADFAEKNAVDLTVAGPEECLVKGITDEFAKRGLKVFGPNKACAEFENSKAFTKRFLQKYHIPTAKYEEYTDPAEAKTHCGAFGYPAVIKADGLAAGKGVIIAQDEKEALAAIDQIMIDKQFGASGDKIVLEEFLTGTEASVLCFLDGCSIVPMESARDYKNIGDGNTGLNTGGMGTYSPNELFDAALKKKVQETILEPILAGMQQEGLDYRGILFVGLMIREGEPKVLEFNVRFGDPETQSVLMRLQTDLVEIMESCNEQTLSKIPICWSEDAAVCVVLASGGYPGAYEKGKIIKGLNETEGVTIFHAGTTVQGENIVTNGGRVLGVASLAKTRQQARKMVYEATEKICFDDVYYRKDIAK